MVNFLHQQPAPASQMEPQMNASPDANFPLDTSGAVYMQSPYITDRNSKVAKRWPDLSPFEQGYVEALLRDFGPAFPDRVTLRFSDLAPETLATIMRDCGGGGQPRGGYEATAAGGAAYWAATQAGVHVGTPPRTVAVNDAGTVVFS